VTGDSPAHHRDIPGTDGLQRSFVLFDGCGCGSVVERGDQQPGVESGDRNPQLVQFNLVAPEVACRLDVLTRGGAAPDDDAEVVSVVGQGFENRRVSSDPVGPHSRRKDAPADRDDYFH